MSGPSWGPGGACEKTYSLPKGIHGDTEFCIQLHDKCITIVYKYATHSQASCEAVLKRFESRLKLF